MSKLKPCPFRVHGERTASLTVEGEYYYNETFMPCMESMCACFHDNDDDPYCDRNGAYMKLRQKGLAELGLKSVPSAPERKTGKWIYKNDLKQFFCSECGYPSLTYDDTYIYGMDLPNYCEDCGADMREGQDG